MASFLSHQRESLSDESSTQDLGSGSPRLFSSTTAPSTAINGHGNTTLSSVAATRTAAATAELITSSSTRAVRRAVLPSWATTTRAAGLGVAQPPLLLPSSASTSTGPASLLVPPLRPPKLHSDRRFPDDVEDGEKNEKEKIVSFPPSSSPVAKPPKQQMTATKKRVHWGTSTVIWIPPRPPPRPEPSQTSTLDSLATPTEVEEVEKENNISGDEVELFRDIRHRMVGEDNKEEKGIIADNISSNNDILAPASQEELPSPSLHVSLQQRSAVSNSRSNNDDEQADATSAGLPTMTTVPLCSVAMMMDYTPTGTNTATDPPDDEVTLLQGPTSFKTPEDQPPRRPQTFAAAQHHTQSPSLSPSKDKDSCCSGGSSPSFRIKRQPTPTALSNDHDGRSTTSMNSTSSPLAAEPIAIVAAVSFVERAVKRSRKQLQQQQDSCTRSGGRPQQQRRKNNSETTSSSSGQNQRTMTLTSNNDESEGGNDDDDDDFQKKENPTTSSSTTGARAAKQHHIEHSPLKQQQEESHHQDSSCSSTTITSSASSSAIGNRSTSSHTGSTTNSSSRSKRHFICAFCGLMENFKLYSSGGSSKTGGANPLFKHEQDLPTDLISPLLPFRVSRVHFLKAFADAKQVPNIPSNAALLKCCFSVSDGQKKKGNAADDRAGVDVGGPDQDDDTTDEFLKVVIEEENATNNFSLATASSASSKERLKKHTLAAETGRTGTSLTLYCHLECALWSPEVYLDEASERTREAVGGPATQGLVHIDDAWSRGLAIKCASCRRGGATVGCCGSHRCQRSYHFPCAVVNSAAKVVPTQQQQASDSGDPTCTSSSHHHTNGAGLLIRRHIVQLDYDSYSLNCGSSHRILSPPPSPRM